MLSGEGVVLDGIEPSVISSKASSKYPGPLYIASIAVAGGGVGAFGSPPISTETAPAWLYAGGSAGGGGSYAGGSSCEKAVETKERPVRRRKFIFIVRI